MPCPLFLPASLLPLSDMYSGTCFIDPNTAIPIEKLTQCCNPGHARSACRHAANIEADSVRLLVRSDDGRFIEIAWATELNHHPIAVGTLRIERLAAPSPVSALDHQAQACATAYLQHTGQI